MNLWYRDDKSMFITWRWYNSAMDWLKLASAQQYTRWKVNDEDLSEYFSFEVKICHDILQKRFRLICVRYESAILSANATLRYEEHDQIRHCDRQVSCAKQRILTWWSRSRWRCANEDLGRTLPSARQSWSSGQGVVGWLDCDTSLSDVCRCPRRSSAGSEHGDFTEICLLVMGVIFPSQNVGVRHVCRDKFGGHLLSCWWACDRSLSKIWIRQWFAPTLDGSWSLTGARCGTMTNANTSRQRSSSTTRDRWSSSWRGTRRSAKTQNRSTDSGSCTERRTSSIRRTCVRKQRPGREISRYLCPTGIWQRDLQLELHYRKVSNCSATDVILRSYHKMICDHVRELDTAFLRWLHPIL